MSRKKPNSIAEFLENHPHPGADPLARLRHVIAIFDAQDDEKLAILATANVYGELGKIGLTWGDLKKIETELAETRGESGRLCIDITCACTAHAAPEVAQ